MVPERYYEGTSKVPYRYYKSTLTVAEGNQTVLQLYYWGSTFTGTGT